MRNPFVCVVGAKGNMGRRYLAVLRFLGVDSCGIDEGDIIPNDGITHFIVATPTHSHVCVLDRLLEHAKRHDEQIRVLCEKPIVKTDHSMEIADVLAAMRIFQDYDQFGCKLFMVNNYAYYPMLTHTNGTTIYDYYHSGGDGLAWDCIQLIHLAKEKILLSNSSPTWTVYLNGTLLSKDSIDMTYVWMVDDFVQGNQGKLWGYNDAALAHLKVLTYIAGNNL